MRKIKEEGTIETQKTLIKYIVIFLFILFYFIYILYISLYY